VLGFLDEALLETLSSECLATYKSRRTIATG